MKEPTYPVEPVLALLEGSQIALIRLAGVAKATVQKWTVNGIPERHADRIACRLGLHPAELWGESYWEASTWVSGYESCEQPVLFAVG